MTRAEFIARTRPARVELRGPCPKRVVDLLDAVSLARSRTRMQLVNEILSEWARVEVVKGSGST